ncbi:DUF945 family protein [Spiribacter onubensis]|uniref:DUF945 family protein n=1 Tax=Spiribacter onubensis TaxID=3122420 RepID=A0ABV3S8X9_9GAMM
MTKQWRWGIVGALILLAGIAAAVPVFNGWQAEQTWHNQIDELNARLAAAGDGSGARIIEYERGAFAARTRALVELSAANFSPAMRATLALPPGPAELMLTQTLRHGWRGVSFDGYLQPVGALAETFARLGGHERSVRIAGRFGMGRQSLTVESELLAGALDPAGTLRLRSEPLRFEADYHDRSDRLTTRLVWPELSLQAPETDGALRLEGVLITTDARLLAGTPTQGLWVGESQLDLGLFSLEPASEPGLTLRQFASRASTREGEAGLVEADFDFDWASLAIGRLPPLRGGFALAIERLAPAGLLALSQHTPGADPPATFDARQRRALALLAEAGPRFALTRLRLENPAGAGMSGTADLRILPLMADRLRMGESGMALWSAARLDAAMGIDDALARAFPAEQASWLRQLQAFGVLQRQDDQWRLEVSMDEGRLSVHGQPWWRGG